MKLLVLILRGLQAGATGPYGNRWIDTPTLDALASGGVVFDWHFAAHPDRAGAERAWRSGCFSFPMSGGSAPPSPPRPDVLSRLAEKGVLTRLIRDTAADGLDGSGEPSYRGDVVHAGGLAGAL